MKREILIFNHWSQSTWLLKTIRILENCVEPESFRLRVQYQLQHVNDEKINTYPICIRVQNFMRTIISSICNGRYVYLSSIKIIQCTQSGHEKLQQTLTQSVWSLYPRDNHKSLSPERASKKKPRINVNFPFSLVWSTADDQHSPRRWPLLCLRSFLFPRSQQLVDRRTRAENSC